MIDVSKILPKLLRTRDENPEAAFLAAKLAWNRAAGSRLQPHAVPFRLDRGTLVIAVADAIWQRQLRSMAGELKFRTNKILGEQLVTVIEFQIAPAIIKLSGARRSEEHHRPTPGPAPQEVLDAATAIEDDDLRARFVRAAENCIDRRESRTNR